MRSKIWSLPDYLGELTALHFHLFQVTGKCGSVRVRLIPAPRGTGIVSAPVPKKLLQMAGIEDCYTSARGQTATLGNFGESHSFLCKDCS